VVETVLRGLHDAQAEHGIESNLIVCGIRNISPESSLRMAELVIAYKNRGVVGFDLAGAEYDYPPKDHQDAFALVRQNNINVTIHAGEAYGPASIAQALHVCGAHRIGHGCRLREDGDLLRYVSTTASRSSAARPPTSRPARCPASPSTRCASTSTSGRGSRSTPITG
jgi:adenosine deaminase